jgi:hypothetical protein
MRRQACGKIPGLQRVVVNRGTPRNHNKYYCPTQNRDTAFNIKVEHSL